MSAGINLLPDDLRRRSIRSRVIRIWVPILLVLSIAVLLTAYAGWAHCEELSLQARAAEPLAGTVHQVLLDIGDAESRISGLQKEILQLAKIQASTDPLNLLHVIGRARPESREKLVLSGIDIANSIDRLAAGEAIITTSVGTQNTVAGQLRRTTTLNLSGFADSEVIVAGFVSGLRESGMFRSVQLKSSTNSESSHVLQQEFVITCIREEFPS